MKHATRKKRETRNAAEPPQPGTPKKRPLMTEGQLAVYFGKSIHSVRRDRRLGLAPPHVLVGRAIRYVPEIVDEYLLRTLSTRQEPQQRKQLELLGAD